MDVRLLLLLILQIAIAYGITWGLRRWARRFNVMDVPNARSSHQQVTPRGGGTAIVLTVILSIVGFALFTGTTLSSQIIGYLVGSVLIAILGFLDDLLSLPAKQRFAAQGLVALGTVVLLGYPTQFSLPLLGTMNIGIIGAIITIIWIVGLINAYNFMDGIDGIAAGNAVIVGLGWLVLYGLAFNPQADVIVLTLGIVSGCLGFLGHNWSPARIFMGDVGSTFLGYTFAVLPLLISADPETPISPAAALVAAALLLWPFLFDTVLTFTRRLLRKENVFAAHRQHLYQRLVIAGLPHPFVTSAYMVLALLGIVFAKAYLDGNTIVLLAPLLVGVGLVSVTYLIAKRQQKAKIPP